MSVIDEYILVIKIDVENEGGNSKARGTSVPSQVIFDDASSELNPNPFNCYVTSTFDDSKSNLNVVVVVGITTFESIFSNLLEGCNMSSSVNRQRINESSMNRSLSDCS